MRVIIPRTMIGLQKDYFNRLMKDKINILNVEIDNISEQVLLQQLRRGVSDDCRLRIKDCRLLLIMNNGDMAAIDEERRMAA